MFVRLNTEATAHVKLAKQLTHPVNRLHFCANSNVQQFNVFFSFDSGVFSSVVVIYKEEGILGFFAGLVPRVFCDIAALWLSNAIVHVINNYVIEDRDIKTYVTASVKVEHISYNRVGIQELINAGFTWRLR